LKTREIWLPVTFRTDEPRASLIHRSRVVSHIEALRQKFNFESVGNSEIPALGLDAVSSEHGTGRGRLEAVRPDTLLRSIQKERY
jgi:hypothetical protein